MRLNGPLRSPSARPYLYPGSARFPASLDVFCAKGSTAAEAILSKLVDEGCDLLIMGGYSHSRFREMIFGGVSREILRETLVPTLVSH